MVKIRAKTHYHGSDGYKVANQEWEVSEEEAKGLVKAGSVELVVEKKEEKTPILTKEDKQAVTTKAAK